MRSPSFGWVVVCGIASLLAFGLAQRVTNTWTIGLLSLVAVFFAFCFLVLLVDWWTVRRNEDYCRRVNVENDTPEVRYVRAVSGLSDAQAQVVREHVPAMHIHGAEPQPIVTFALNGQEINHSFVCDYLGDARYGPPSIRDYSEGTRERRWAQLITGYLVQRGWANEAVGPYSAQWVEGGYELAKRYFKVD